MTLALSSAIAKCPPAPNGSAAEVNQCYTAAVASSASTPTDDNVLPSLGGIPYTGCFVSWISQVDCHLRVSSSAAACGSATQSDFFLPAGVQMDFWHDPRQNNTFSVIGNTGAVLPSTLYRFRSNY